MKTKRWISLSYLLLFALSAFSHGLIGQNAVNVSIEADDAHLFVGDTTTVRVFGQIDSSIESQSSQIFSWYIDILNEGGAVTGYSNLEIAASDNTSETSGDGIEEGAHLKGIHDTFLFHPEAGKGERVLLVQFDVAALAVGSATVRVGPGSTGRNLNDFLVSRTGEGSFTGGNYTDAAIEITVGDPVITLELSVVKNAVNLNFNTIPGFDHTIQSSSALHGADWSDLAGGPHNSGTAVDDLTGTMTRFYRVVLVQQ